MRELKPSRRADDGQGRSRRTPHGVRELKRQVRQRHHQSDGVAPHTGCVSWKRRAIDSRHEHDDSLHEQIRLWGLSLFLRAKIATQVSDEGAAATGGVEEGDLNEPREDDDDDEGDQLHL